MRLPKALLIASLAANAALLGVVAVRISPPAPGSWLGGKLARLTGSGTASGSIHAVDRPPGGSQPAVVSSRTWSALETNDLPSLVARLRAAGFPPEMVRAIVAAEVNRQFFDRYRQAYEKYGAATYWKRGDYNAGNADLRAISREEAAQMKSLLGPDAEFDYARVYRSANRQAYGNLDPGKVEKLEAINSDYGDLTSSIYAAANGITLPEDREKLAYLEKEHQADLAKLLTPDELSEYNLRTGSTTRQLAFQLAIVNPTEEEFRTISKLQQSVTDAFGNQPGPLTPEQVAQRQAAQQAVNEQIAAALGPDRGAAVAEAMDPKNQQINQLVIRLGLPQQVATDTAAVQQDITQRATQIRAEASVSRADRNAQLAALATEASTRLTGILGPNGLQAYQSYGGNWLRGNLLQPLPPRPNGRP